MLAHDLILEHATSAHPEEACGILIGRIEAAHIRVRRALPCRNEAPPAQRPRRFEIDPRIVLNVQRELRTTDQAIVGFYHSHPDTAPAPSRTDLEYLRLWPDTIWLIVGVDAKRQAVTRAWWLDALPGDDVRELGITSPAPAAH